MVDPNPVGGGDPASDPVALTVATYDRVAGAYVRLNGDPRILADARERFATAIAGAAPPEHYRILDAGCGPGRDSKWFAERGFQVVGVDLSAGMLAEARRAAPSAEFRQADLRALDFPAGSFDGIWCSASLLHLDRSEIPAVLQTFNRLLGHGWLWLTLKAGDGSEITDRVYGPGNPRRFTYFNPHEVELLVERADFEVRELSVAPSSATEPRGWISVLAQTALRPPLQGAVAAILDDAGRVFLSERADGRGWNMPAGFVEHDEGPRDGIVREVQEETGLDVEIISLVGVYDRPITHRGRPWRLISHCFLARRIGGQPVPTNESLQHGWFSPDNLPVPMSSVWHIRMLQDALRKQAGRQDVVYRTEADYR